MTDIDIARGNLRKYLSDFTGQDLRGIPSFDEKLVPKAKAMFKKNGGNFDDDPGILGIESYEELFKFLDTLTKKPNDVLKELKRMDVIHNNAETQILNDDGSFKHYDPSIPVKPLKFQYEILGDLFRWAIMEGWALLVRCFSEKADFVCHQNYQSYFKYPLQAKKGITRIALFSDWATGYYHSRYIAKYIKDLMPDVAIHLGDVYYNGGKIDFEKNFTPILEKYVLKYMHFYALNANHEMGTNGHQYFEFLGNLRSWKDNKFHQQFQEGSYFCLENENFQVIGLDTAYDSNGRLTCGLKEWLQKVINKEKKLIRILLTQNEPYSHKKHKKRNKFSELWYDLKEFRNDFHLWFWGDEHYCALFSPFKGEEGVESIPFWGSCIGHGGFPYTRIGYPPFNFPNLSKLPAPVVWWDGEPRFWFDDSLRKNVGNNGFCMLELKKGKVRLEYIDWTKRLRSWFEFELVNKELIKTGEGINVNIVLD